MLLRTIYKVLSVVSMITAISKGRGGRFFVRRAGMRGVARLTRRIKF